MYSVPTSRRRDFANGAANRGAADSASNQTKEPAVAARLAEPGQLTSNELQKAESKRAPDAQHAEPFELPDVLNKPHNAGHGVSQQVAATVADTPMAEAEQATGTPGGQPEVSQPCSPSQAQLEEAEASSSQGDPSEEDDGGPGEKQTLGREQSRPRQCAEATGKASEADDGLAECAAKLEDLLAFGEAATWKDYYDDAGADVDCLKPEGDADLVSACNDAVRAWKASRRASELLLLQACRSGDEAVVKQALTAIRHYVRLGCTRAMNYEECTPLHFAAERNDQAIAQLVLCSKQVDVNGMAKPTHKDGTTPLFRACTRGLTGMVKLLLSHGADLSIVAPGKGGNGPLHEASSRGDHATVLALLNDSRDQAAVTRAVKMRNYDSETPLHLACLNGHTAVAEALISKGAEMEARDGSAKALTPLHRAINNGHLDTVKLLVERGANTQTKTRARLMQGRTALDLAKRRKHSHIVAFLELRGMSRMQSSSSMSTPRPMSISGNSAN